LWGKPVQHLAGFDCDVAPAYHLTALSDAARSPVLSPAPLLEREQEVASLDALVRGAASGKAGVALVEGPPGIGKTRLLREARARAGEAGFRVLFARGGELEREFPFGVVRQLFEPVLVQEELGGRALTGAAARAARVFEPVSEAEEAGDPSFALLHGLYWLTANLSADRVLLVAVDDLHWCDPASIRFITYLVRRLEGLPVLAVLGVRSSEQVAESPAVREIVRDSLTVSIRPHPLSRAAVAALARDRLGDEPDDEFTSACHDATGGNPLLLDELLKALDAEGVRADAAHVGMVTDLGPRAVSRAVLTRVARLSDHAAKVARSVAVLGGDADVSTAAALADLDEGSAREAASALMRAEILEAAPYLSFVHPLVAATVYKEMSPHELELQHERAAVLLASAGAPDEQVAAHLLAASPRGETRVVEVLRKAARVGLQRGAAEGAVAYLTRALAEPPPREARAEILIELGRAEALTSGPAAVDHLQQGYELLDDPLQRGLVAQTLARTLLFTGRPEEGAALARRAAAELPAEHEDLRQGLEAFALMAVFFGAGDAEALERLHRHRELPVPPGPGAMMMAAVAGQEWAYGGGPADACAELSRQALAGGGLIGLDDGFFAVVAITTLVLADRGEAADRWEELIVDAHQRGSLFSKCAISLWHGFTLCWWGDLEEAEESLRTAARELELWGFGGPESHCAAFLSAVLRERGRLDDAWGALRLVSDPGDDSEGARFWLDSRLELLLAERRYEEVLADADDFQRRFGFIRNPMDTPWREHKAVALSGLGRVDEALVLAREDLALARAWGAPQTLARSLRLLGTLERGEGLDHLREAVAAVEGSPARLEHAKSLAALGTGLRHARRPGEAREPLRRALELAEACGAQSLADGIRSELYAAGARPRTAALKGVKALTASERRVAELAAEGRTNREIAQALFVTPKTVEVHLSNTYRKLGIRSRRELAAELAVA
jgi:DNA-binding CsgD family transcriptional regulator